MTIEGNEANLVDDPQDTVVRFSGPVAEGILGGGRLVRVRRDGAPDLYVQLYLIPNTNNQWVYYQYDPQDGAGQDENADGVPDQIKETFGNNMPPVFFLSEDRFNQISQNGQLTYAGPASNVINTPGNFETLWFQTMQNALAAAGVADPGITGRLLRDPEYARLVTRAALGERMTEAQFQAQFRNLPVYREIYPGIDFFLNRGDANPEASYAAYRARVTPLFRQLGIQPDADGSYRSTVGQYLDAGISDDELERFTPTLKKIQQNPGLKAQMDAWARYELGRNLNFTEFVDVLRGTTDPELERVIEGATLAYQAEQAGVNISVAELRRIAQATDLTEREALGAFTEFDRTILSINRHDLARSGLTREDFLSAAVGIEGPSGMSIAATQNVARRLATDRGFSDDPTGSFFLGFTQQGVAQRQGLARLAPAGG